MRNRPKQSGITLTEILVVISIIGILMGISIPAAKQLAKSFESSTSTRQLINAALSNARAIAVREQTYAGVRFQEDEDGNTYIIFIIHDEGATGLANGFRAVMGRKPMKLPEDVGVLSGFWVNRTGFNASKYQSWDLLLPMALTDADLFNPTNFVSIAGQQRNIFLLDASTFSIIFTPQGKLTVHRTWIRNKDGQTGLGSNDMIFNVYDFTKKTYIGQFLQDAYGNSPNYGIGPEISVQSFFIYSKSQYQQAPADKRVSDYLSILDPEYISPYTGELVMEYRE